MIIRGMNRMGALLRAPGAYKAEYRNLIRLGLPVMVTQLGIIIVSFADTIMVGRCGTRELGAAAFVNSLFTIGIVMQIGFANGLTPLVGQLFSKGDSRRVGAMMKAGIISNVLVSMVFTLLFGIGYFFIGSMGQPEELLPLIRPYYLVVLSTLLPLAVFNAFQQTSNGCTDTSTPMWIIIGCNILNIIGNWLLIGGECGFPRLGLLGAGVSTAAARWLGTFVIVGVYAFSGSRRKYVEACKGARGASLRNDCLTVWRTSYPVMIQSGIECVMWTLGGVVSGWFGTVQLASYQVVVTLSQLGFMIYLGIGVATSIRVANLTGLGDFRGVRRITTAGLHLTLVLATLASGVFYAFSRPMLSVFTSDLNVQLAALPLILPLILYQYGDAVQITYANALRGTSEVRPLLWVALIAYVVIGTPVMFWLANGLGTGNVGVFYSFSVALFTASVGLWLAYRRAVAGLEKRV